MLCGMVCWEILDPDIHVDIILTWATSLNIIPDKDTSSWSSIMAVASFMTLHLTKLQKWFSNDLKNTTTSSRWWFNLNISKIKSNSWRVCVSIMKGSANVRYHSTPTEVLWSPCLIRSELFNWQNENLQYTKLGDDYNIIVLFFVLSVLCVSWNNVSFYLFVRVNSSSEIWLKNRKHNKHYVLRYIEWWSKICENGSGILTSLKCYTTNDP